MRLGAQEAIEYWMKHLLSWSRGFDSHDFLFQMFLLTRAQDGMIENGQ